MNTVSKFVHKTAKRLRVFAQLDLLATFALRRKCKLDGWASVYVYPRNRVKVSEGAKIHVTNGLLTIAKPWFEVQPVEACSFEMEGKSQLDCQGNFDFARGSHCKVKDGAVLCLGNNSRVGAGSSFECNNEIVIGNGCWVSNDVVVADAGRIVIEDGVWIGNGAKITGNVRIGRGAVIGEGVSVAEDVGDYMIITVG